MHVKMTSELSSNIFFTVLGNLYAVETFSISQRHPDLAASHSTPSRPIWVSLHCNNTVRDRAQPQRSSIARRPPTFQAQIV